MDNNNESKIKALEQAISQIEKQFGKGSIMKLGDGYAEKVEVISSGCLTLDMALGIGGFPRGRIVEIYGPESSGKTTVALQVVAEAQKLEAPRRLLTPSTRLTLQRVRAGVDLIICIFHNPITASKALDIADSLVRSGAVDIIA